MSLRTFFDHVSRAILAVVAVAVIYSAAAAQFQSSEPPPARALASAK